MVLWAGTGCYQTKYPLGSADNATVDPAYVGNFTVPDDQGSGSNPSPQPTATAATQNDKKGTIIIRNIDGHRYYVECDDEKGSGSEPMRMIGFITDVNGVAIANLQMLDPDGKTPDGYLLMRVSLSADHNTLSYRDFDDKFFADKKIDSSDAELKVIAANLDNDQMYSGPMVTGTRVAIQK
jgi:hypothetical protein